MSTVLKSGLDPASFSSVTKPADDLFRYVNGPWIDTYRLPADRARYGAFDKLAEDSESQIRDILEDPASPAVKSAAIYASFLDTAAIEAAGAAPIRGDLKAIDKAATKVDLISVLGSLNPSGGPDLIDMAVFGDPGNPTHNIVHMEQGGLGLPDEAYYREERYARVRDAYTVMAARLLRLAGYAESQDDADSQAARLLNLETRIASYHWDVVATRDEEKTYNPVDLAQLTNSLRHVDLTAWAAAWQRAYDAGPSSARQPVNLQAALRRAIVHEPSFLKGLDGLWESASLADLKLWARAHTLIGWSGFLSHDFDQTRFDFYGKVLSGTTEMRARWKRAVALVNGLSGEEVGREYVRRHFPESSKRRIDQLVNNLITAYRVSISGCEWLGDDTKRKALDKLGKFAPKVGYTKHWRDYTALDVRRDAGLVVNVRNANLYETAYQLRKAGRPVDRDEWLMNPQTVNAYYEPTLNVIVFPAAILQPPFFDPQADDAANYGGIGAVIGHEIGHGFDDQGSKYDGLGRLHDWWTTEDRHRFEQRTKALIGQYDRYVPRQLADHYADTPEKTPHVNGALTIGENIGDLGGVTISLKAYAFALDPHAATDSAANSLATAADPDPETIRTALEGAPTIDGFTGLQRFFLSYASVWRSKTRDQLAEQYLQIDPHSPAEFRTNGIARNVDLFYQAFGVKPGDGMWQSVTAGLRPAGLRNVFWSRQRIRSLGCKAVIALHILRDGCLCSLGAGRLRSGPGWTIAYKLIGSSAEIVADRGGLEYQLALPLPLAHPLFGIKQPGHQQRIALMHRLQDVVRQISVSLDGYPRGRVITPLPGIRVEVTACGCQPERANGRGALLPQTYRIPADVAGNRDRRLLYGHRGPFCFNG